MPRIETLVIIVFFLSFLIWTASKCKTQAVMEELNLKQEKEEAEAQALEMERLAVEKAKADAAAAALASAQTNPQLSTPQTGIATPSSSGAFQGGSNLFVTIDGLNMRTHPHLDSSIIVRLNLHETVQFMNEVTDSTQAINLGKAIANEPWIKVRHAKGRTGWVYGAGVHYYKMKNPDAE